MDIAVQDVIAVMRKVRGILLPHHGRVAFANKAVEAYDLVTKLDVEVEEFLRRELAGLHPDVPFVGEETGGDRTASVKWLCDPIDGTAHFVRGTAFCSTMLALIEDGTVTMGIIYDFVTDTMYYAKRGEGAFRNGERIQVSDRPLKQSFLAWETHLERPDNVPTHMALYKKSCFFKAVCSGYEHAMVASGQLEGRICFDPIGKDYDFAAGSLLIEEAGGVVANLGRQTYDYTNYNFIAANPVVFKELTEGPDAIFPIEHREQ